MANVKNNLTVQFIYIGSKFYKNDTEMVVARYNKNVEWVRPYQDMATVYNKGQRNHGLAYDINIPNIGREGRTYLNHNDIDITFYVVYI